MNFVSSTSKKKRADDFSIVFKIYIQKKKKGRGDITWW